MADELVPSPHQFAGQYRADIRALAEFRGRARTIADDAALSAEDRLIRLKRLAAHAAGQPAERLAQAFQKDVTAGRFRNWSELIAYCRFAAAPVGRFLIEIHGEDSERARAAETLYAAKHVLRRVQTCKTDYLTHGRVYLPGDWMRRAGVEASAIGASATSPELRRVFDHILDGVDDMIRVARVGLAGLADRQFRIAMQTEIAATQRLAASLRRSDPLARSVSLSRPAFLLCVIVGHARGYRRP